MMIFLKKMYIYKRKIGEEEKKKEDGSEKKNRRAERR